MEYFVNSFQQLAISTVNEKDALETSIMAEYNCYQFQRSKSVLNPWKSYRLAHSKTIEGRRSVVETIWSVYMYEDRLVSIGDYWPFVPVIRLSGHVLNNALSQNRQTRGCIFSEKNRIKTTQAITNNNNKFNCTITVAKTAKFIFIFHPPAISFIVITNKGKFSFTSPFQFSKPIQISINSMMA